MANAKYINSAHLQVVEEKRCYEGGGKGERKALAKLTRRRSYGSALIKSNLELTFFCGGALNESLQQNY